MYVHSNNNDTMNCSSTLEIDQLGTAAAVSLIDTVTLVFKIM